MTTKLQQHSISLPLRIIHQYCYPKPEAVLICTDCSLSLMDKILELQNIETMKRTMLMQEQLFKQQVHELHRLYDHQKKLMQELDKKVQVFHARSDDQYPKELINGTIHERSRIPIINHLFDDDEEKKNCHNLRRMDDDEESDVQVELTLSIGSHCTRIHNQRSKSSQSDDESNKALKELDSSSTKTNGQPIKSEPIKSAGITSSSNSTTSSSNVRRESNNIARPHWLMQDLSLNRTT